MTDAEFQAWIVSPSARRTVLVEVAVRVSGVETTYYLSNRAYNTTGSDTPANISYEPCITGGVSFSAEINIDGDPSISYGDLVISNKGGSRDDWQDPATYVWANRAVQVYIGDATWDRATFRKIGDGVVRDITVPEAEKLSLNLLDKLQRLNKPMTETLLGGSTANKDKLLPLGFGEFFNATPLCTNPATLEYQVHQAAIEDVIEVRSNGGVPVAITKFLSTGKFTLSASPGNTNITCSVQGAKPGGTYSSNISTLIQHIVTTYGPSNSRFSAVANVDLDSSSLSTFASTNTQTVGVYCSDRENVLEVCQRLAHSIGAHLVMTSLGLLRLVQVALPAAGTPTPITADDFEYHSLTPSGRVKVKATCKLGYCRNYTPQTTLASGMATSSVPYFQEEWLTVTRSDATATSVYKIDNEPVMEETCLQIESEATTEADRRRDLWKTPRRIFTMKCFAHMLLLELGDAVTLTHPRFGLSGGVTGMVVKIERDWLKGRVTVGVLV